MGSESPQSQKKKRSSINQSLTRKLLRKFISSKEALDPEQEEEAPPNPKGSIARRRSGPESPDIFGGSKRAGSRVAPRRMRTRTEIHKGGADESAGVFQEMRREEREREVGRASSPLGIGRERLDGSELGTRSPLGISNKRESVGEGEGRFLVPPGSPRGGARQQPQPHARSRAKSHQEKSMPRPVDGHSPPPLLRRQKPPLETGEEEQETDGALSRDTSKENVAQPKDAKK